MDPSSCALICIVFAALHLLSAVIMYSYGCQNDGTITQRNLMFYNGTYAPLYLMYPNYKSADTGLHAVASYCNVDYCNISAASGAYASREHL